MFIVLCVLVTFSADVHFISRASGRSAADYVLLLYVCVCVRVCVCVSFRLSVRM